METNNTLQSVAWKAYPVFMMYEQLCFFGIVDRLNPVDEIWQTCIDHYDKFSTSEFNNTNVNEYDCITNYVQSLSQEPNYDSNWVYISDVDCESEIWERKDVAYRVPIEIIRHFTSATELKNNQ
jgi:hypothetical protein